MISLHHKQQGAAAVMLAVVMLFVLTVSGFTFVRSAVNETRMSANIYRAGQAFEASEAGLQTALMSLRSDPSVVYDDDDDGSVSVEMTSDTLTNNSTYTATITNITSNNFGTLELSSVGQNPDTTATRTVRRILYNNSYLATEPPMPLIAHANVSLGGNVSVENTTTDQNIWSGGTVSLTGSADTITSDGGTSGSSGLGDDVVENDSNLSGLSGDEFFENFFGADKSDAMSAAHVVYTNSSSTNYSADVDGEVGKVIWIEQTSGEARINSNVTIGSEDQPVILIVNGDFQLNGNATVYGLVYVANDWNNTGGGNLTVNGAVIVEGSVNTNGTPNVVYDETILDRLDDTVGTYTEVAGSWHDF